MDKSRRFCLTCKKLTTWKRKRKMEHSYCAMCGGLWARRRYDKHIKPTKRRNKVNNKSEKVYFGEDYV